MVDQSLFVGGIAQAKARRSWRAVLLSVIVQALVCACALTLPLLWPEKLPAVEAAVRAIQLPPAPRVEIPKPPPISVVSKPTQAMAAPAETSLATAATRLGGRISPGAPTDSPIPPGPGVDPRFNMGGPGDPEGSPFGTGVGSSGPIVSLAHPAANTPVRISQGVSQGLLLAPIQAVYPRIAITAGIAGTVIVSARIDRQGRVIGASASSGPPMLRQAAVEAVSSARYRPYLLNGEPTEVLTTYTVTFHLGS